MTDRRIGEAVRALRVPRPVRWTRQRRKQFLTALAETSNVSASARAAGMAVSPTVCRSELLGERPWKHDAL